MTTGRSLIITNSVWRPLFGPLQDWPLGLCDYSSIDPQRDLVPSDNIYTHVVTETYNVYHHHSHRWYFLGDMKPNELLVFKSYDSMAAEANARGTLQMCLGMGYTDPKEIDSMPPRCF